MSIFTKIFQFVLDFISLFNFTFNEIKYRHCLKKAVLKQFPDARRGTKIVNFFDSYTPDYWNSKLVNQNYSRIEIINCGWTLIINPIYDISFIWNNQNIVVPIYSAPRDIILSSASPSKGKIIIHNTPFTKMFINQILEFFTFNKSCKLDTDNLDPKLKMLLTFA